MHSLPSRRRLPQPNFFRFKCYRLSPLPVPPPSVPAPALHLPGLLPTAHLPVDTPPSVPANTPSFTRTLAPAAVCRQARRPPTARGQTGPQAPGTVRQADSQLSGSTVGQGRRTFPQSPCRDSVTVPAHIRPPPAIHLIFLKSRVVVRFIFNPCLIKKGKERQRFTGWCSGEHKNQYPPC